MLRWLSFKKAFYCAVACVIYLLVFGCKADYSSAFAPTRYTCDAANFFVYPTWNTHFQPHLEWIDQNTGIVEKVTPVWKKTHASWAKIDENYALSYTLDKYKVQLQDWAAVYVHPYIDVVTTQLDYVWARIVLYYKGSAGPVLEHYFNTYNHHLVDSVDNSVSYVKRHSALIFDNTRKHSGRFIELQVVPKASSLWATVSTNAFVVKVANVTRLLYLGAQISRLFDALLEESGKINSSFKNKTEFVKSELKHYIESGVGKQRRASGATSEDVIDVVKTILEDITSAVGDEREPIPHSSVTETDEAVASTVGSILSEVLSESDEPIEEGKESIEEENIETDTTEVEVTVTDTVTDTLETTVVEETVDAEELADAADAVDASGESDEEEPVTETFWFTETVYEDGATGTPEEEIATVDVEDLQKSHYNPKDIIDLEILYWKSKVDKMLKLAYNSLEDDMIPVLNATLEPLRDEISANFTQLQKDNYERYKKMNILISKINKDFEHMKETNQLIVEPEVDRQMMRDEISACREAVEQTMQNVEDALNEQHAEIVKQYFVVTQETVDVIESYAETLLSEFNNRLTEIIRVLDTDPEYEDKLGWAAWKENHKIKELIFQLRDKIFDEANQYKENHRGEVKPRGLEPWIDYLISINFHINFLLRDTDEYLQLVRAKANVAYQMREALTRQFEEAEAEAEKAAAKAAEEEAARKIADAQRANEAIESAAAEASFAAEFSAPGVEDVPQVEPEEQIPEPKVNFEQVAEPVEEIVDEAVDEVPAEFVDETPEEISTL